MTQLPSFSERLLAWFDKHGRTSLPWQENKTPYRVWVSEIMLQQTQVSTVIPYYTRFMTVYPSVTELAEAPLDDVLSLWTGLGYYARARNMHRAAQMVVDEFDGEFPNSVQELEALPGIGRSTAGAIVTLGHGGWAPILDGNVKRVLARFHAIEGWPGKADVMAALWRASESHTPRTRTDDYTQGIMDLGATLCTKSNPGCLHCPLTDDCQARIENRTADLPGKKPKKVIPVRSTVFVLGLDRESRILLERRPPMGIWGGLWSFPEIEHKSGLASWLSGNGLTQTGDATEQSGHTHTFSHFKLEITPIVCSIETVSQRISERDDLRWFTIDEASALGLPAPVLKILNTLSATN